MVVDPIAGSLIPDDPTRRAFGTALELALVLGPRRVPIYPVDELIKLVAEPLQRCLRRFTFGLKLSNTGLELLHGSGFAGPLFRPPASLPLRRSHRVSANRPAGHQRIPHVVYR